MMTQPFLLKISIDRAVMIDAAALCDGLGALRVDVNPDRGVLRVVSLHPLTEEAVRTAIEQLVPSPITQDQAVCAVPGSVRPSGSQLVVMVLIVAFVGWVFSRLGWLSPEIALGTTVGFGGAFLIGFLAASSSCMALSGGLLLALLPHFHKRFATLSFILGRLLSYAGFGALIGLIGKSFVPSPTILAVITLVAAIYMIVAGLNMLQLTPRWLKRLTPTVPRRLTHAILGAENSTNPVAPLLLGAATFFLPCGFTQALQLYALTTGSAWTSGVILFAFALGTAPSLLLLGWASTSLKGRVSQYFFRFVGVMIILLGVSSVQNGLTILGTPLHWPSFAVTTIPTATDPNVRFEGGEQIIQLELTGKDPFYLPSDHFTVREGVPVKLEITGDATGGCRSMFQIPEFDVQLALIDPVNTVEFTPDTTGEVTFSCSMGMYRGTLTVVPNT